MSSQNLVLALGAVIDELGALMDQSERSLSADQHLSLLPAAMALARDLHQSIGKAHALRRRFLELQAERADERWPFMAEDPRPSEPGEPRRPAAPGTRPLERRRPGGPERPSACAPPAPSGVVLEFRRRS